ncbi:MAG: phage minor capsid protein, partial [Lachnospiraceae bacterium]|nr:phage minor capsid protein [Lachnospiraceae bacterium]
MQGLCGANCRHNYMPFIPGVSTRTYTPEQLEKLRAEEKETKIFGTKEYTTYEATQQQRALERQM